MSQPPADPGAPADHPSLDPRTPLVVGVGQASERLGEPGYRRRSPVDLAADAAREALDDTGGEPAAVAAAIEVVIGVRQFENSHPRARAPLGRSDNYPRSVAGRIAATRVNGANSAPMAAAYSSRLCPRRARLALSISAYWLGAPVSPWAAWCRDIMPVSP